MAGRGVPELHRINRRLFLRDVGRGTLAIAVLGPGLIACSNGDDGTIATVPSTTRASTTTTPPATAGATSTTDAPEPSTTIVEAETTDTPPLTEAQLQMLRWERVNLGFVSAYVLARGREIAIVDTGTGGSATQIGDALTGLGANWDDVDHVILTHLHGDHVGGLRSVLDAAPNATPYAGEADVAGITSTRPLTAVNDGDEVFGLEIIGTPGHTPGHIAVLDAASGFLVAGDSLNEANGMIVGPNPNFSSDHDDALDAVRKLATREFDTAVFGHGEPYIGDASEAVVALAQSL